MGFFDLFSQFGIFSIVFTNETALPADRVSDKEREFEKVYKLEKHR